jgi:hypothetical protein
VASLSVASGWWPVASAHPAAELRGCTPLFDCGLPLWLVCCEAWDCRKFAGHKPLTSSKKRMRPGGVEPPTFGSVVQRSIQLSYGRVVDETATPVRRTGSCRMHLQCPGQDSNLHAISGTGPSNQPVYQFQHLGKPCVASSQWPVNRTTTSCNYSIRPALTFYSREQPSAIRAALATGHWPLATSH